MPPPSQDWNEQTWRYATMQDMRPNRVQSSTGLVSEYQKMLDIIRRFYERNCIPFDGDAYTHDATTFLIILKAIDG